MWLFRFQRVRIYACILENCLGLRLWSDFICALAWMERRMHFDRVLPHVIFLGVTSAVILGIL
jgi:hypothetical protein